MRWFPRWLLALAFAFVASVWLAPRTAYALDCGGRLIDPGTSQAYVQVQCGEPTFVRARTETRALATSYGVSRWQTGAATSVTVQIETLDV